MLFPSASPLFIAFIFRVFKLHGSASHLPRGATTAGSGQYLRRSTIAAEHIGDLAV